MNAMERVLFAVAFVQTPGDPMYRAEHGARAVQRYRDAMLKRNLPVGNDRDTQESEAERQEIIQGLRLEQKLENAPPLPARVRESLGHRS